MVGVAVDHYFRIAFSEISKSLGKIDLLFYIVIVLKTELATVSHVFRNGNSFLF